MAAGDIKGTFENSRTGEGSTLVASGSISVVSGDLILVLWGIRDPSNTPTFSDSHSDSFTTLSVLNANNWGKGHPAYFRATSSFTLTSVTATYTNTTEDVAMVVAVIEGTAASPLDVQGTPIADTSSPMTCPASGTLAQASEIVLGLMYQRDGPLEGNIAAASGFTMTEAESSADASASSTVAICHKVVSATTTQTPGFTSTNNNDAGLNTVSFKLAGAAAPEFVPKAKAWLTAALAAWAVLAPSPPVTANNLCPALIGPVDSPPRRNSQLEAIDRTVARWWGPGDPQPILANNLSPALIGPVDSPPRRTAQLEAIDRSTAYWWIPPDPLPTLGKKLVQEFVAPVNNPPFGQRKDISAGFSVWPQGWALPQSAPKLVQPFVATPENPPFSQRRDISAGVFSAWPQGWALPPASPKLVQQAATVQLAARSFSVVLLDDSRIILPSRGVAALLAVAAQVDEPPYDMRRAINSLTSVSGWPSGWDLPITGQKLVWPGAVAQVDNPPTRSSANYHLTVSLWPSGWALPLLPPKLVPGSVDFPAYSNAEQQHAAGGEWPQGWRLPIVGLKLVQAAAAAQLDNPPVRSNAWRQLASGGEWPSGWSLPIIGPKIVPSTPSAELPSGADDFAVVETYSQYFFGRSQVAALLFVAAQVDNPPTRSNAKEQLAAGGQWPSGWDLPIVGPKLVPGSVDQPARTSSIRQAVAFSQWPRGWDLPLLPPKITPPSNDSPHVTSSAEQQHAAGGEWPQGWRLPIVGPKLVQRGPDSPPVKSNAWRQLAAGGEWPSGWSLPLVGPKLVQPAPPAAVNNPPFDMRGRVNAFLSVYAWFPAPNQPTPLVKGKINPSALNVLYNPPPFSHRGRTVQAATAIASWPIGWTLPVVKPPVIRDEPPTVVGQVTDYIVTFGRRRGRR